MLKTVHIAHLINPVSLQADHELSRSQPITFESMRSAVKYARKDINVELLTAQFAEDEHIIPDYFRRTTNLQHSVLDFESFSNPKKLPVLKDLLDKLYHESTADYLIYTNADIAVQPMFYEVVADRIRHGFDAFIINRRRIPARFDSAEALPEMYRLDGSPHPGFDCFVFHRSLYPQFKLEKVCIGIPFVEITFSQNLFCYSNNFRLFERDRLTFHLGMEIFKKRDPQYLRYNRQQYRNAIKKMWPELDNRKFPWGQRNVLYRMIKWGLHPAIPIRLAMQLELRRYGL
ncbi:MAG TPA: hypothetical protein VGD17_04850 [Chitinophagaceae bacterium]